MWGRGVRVRWSIQWVKCKRRRKVRLLSALSLLSLYPLLSLQFCVWPSSKKSLFIFVIMSWYCVEQRNDSVQKFGRFQRRFLFGGKYSIHSSLETATARTPLQKEHNVSNTLTYTLLQKKRIPDTLPFGYWTVCPPNDYYENCVDFYKDQSPLAFSSAYRI